MASTLAAIRESTSVTCLAAEPPASVTTISQPLLAASSCMLLVSARRHGLSLTVWENPTLYLSFLASLGSSPVLVLPVLPEVAAVAVGLVLPVSPALQPERASMQTIIAASRVSRRLDFTTFLLLVPSVQYSYLFLPA